MAKYEIGTKLKKRDNQYGATFAEGEIVAQHKDGRWILEITEPIPGNEALIGDLRPRTESILNEFYEVVKPETFFSLGSVYRFPGSTSMTYTILDLYTLPNGYGDMVDYAVARVASAYDGDFPEVLGVYEFKKMEKL